MMMLMLLMQSCSAAVSGICRVQGLVPTVAYSTDSMPNMGAAMLMAMPVTRMVVTVPMIMIVAAMLLAVLVVLVIVTGWWPSC